ncbi:MAG: pyridoxamine 5'-phosphate oxidase [Actinomycetales bacterium]|nr:pyridoxamine 5'-phosphate oxidase [Actinomycetales bacterium]
MSLWSPPPDQPPSTLADLRVSYDQGVLDEESLASTPLQQFGLWLSDAVTGGVVEPNAMVLATVGDDEQPSGRTVLLKDVDPRGFVFFTNYGSTKSRQLEQRPGASLVFPWFSIHRQVVVIGRAERLPEEESAAYFSSRPHGSRLGAWASRQSEVIPDREVLESTYAALAAEYPEGSEVPVPDFWGGWLVRPASVEFWQGRVSRLHDRLRFRSRAGGPADLADAGAWLVERLSP